MSAVSLMHSLVVSVTSVTLNETIKHYEHFLRHQKFAEIVRLVSTVR
jgi:hypothetical protein